ncbi:MAG: PDGLE domain-containing protein [Candidatus Omnitrophica bacterium]|nr:PDGLE domain-containing protein [Candidatus Omnitrophota bacterium]
MKITTKFWLGIAILVIVSPLGLFVPAFFKAGSAWGEWGAEEIKELVGYVPQGLQRLSQAWKAPLPDYAINGWGTKGLLHQSFAYILSAIVGIVCTVIIVILLVKLLTRKNE